MKKMVFILAVLLSFSSLAQEIPKHTWKIVIKNTLSADENFTLVGRTLAENDYTIDTKDKEFYTIKTSVREIGKSLTGTYYLNFAIKEGSISITGQYDAAMELNLGGVTAKSSPDKIENIGGRGSCPRISFGKMNDFALKLGSDPEYITD